MLTQDNITMTKVGDYILPTSYKPEELSKPLPWYMSLTLLVNSYLLFNSHPSFSDIPLPTLPLLNSIQRKGVAQLRRIIENWDLFTLLKKKKTILSPFEFLFRNFLNFFPFLFPLRFLKVSFNIHAAM